MTVVLTAIIGPVLLWMLAGLMILGITGTKPPNNVFLLLLALIVWPFYVGCSMANCCDCAM